MDGRTCQALSNVKFVNVLIPSFLPPKSHPSPHQTLPPHNLFSVSSSNLEKLVGWGMLRCPVHTTSALKSLRFPATRRGKNQTRAGCITWTEITDLRSGALKRESCKPMDGDGKMHVERNST